MYRAPYVACHVGMGCGGGAATSTVGIAASVIRESPFYGLAQDAKYQILYRAADLTAAGLTAGVLTEISFNIGAKLSRQPYRNFTVSIGCTERTYVTSGGFMKGASVVYGPSSYTTGFGWNTIVFDRSFPWDGTSNIFVEICFDNSSATLYDNIRASSYTVYFRLTRNRNR